MREIAKLLLIVTLVFSSFTCADLGDSFSADQGEEGVLKANDCSPELKKDGLLVVGAVERVLLEPQGVMFEARIDTGAHTSSIDARDITPFERDGKPWVRFELPRRDEKDKSLTIETPVVGRTQIKRHGQAPVERLTVTLRVVLGPLDQLSEFTLADREGYDYSVLIGRSYLRGSAIVNVDRQLTLSPKPSSSSE